MLDIIIGYGGYASLLIGFVLLGVVAYIKMNEAWKNFLISDAVPEQ